VALLNNFSKNFELVLFNRLNFQIKNIISEHQHGFVRGRSTVTNLLAVLLSLLLTLLIPILKPISSLYLDFSKAFDKMDHGVILSKLDSIGFTPHLIQFFKSYLEGRRQYVYCNGQYSKNIYMTSGVPQGSVCGSLVFNLFINDVVDDLSCEVLLYADDIKIFTKINSLIDCVRFQINLDKIMSWCESKSLPPNISKCNIMSFSLSLCSSILLFSNVGQTRHCQSLIMP
jgi:hypothetical protein